MNEDNLRQHIMSLGLKEVTLDDVVAMSKDKELSVSLLRKFQDEKLGILLLGRRGQKTRFVFGVQPQENKKARIIATALEKAIATVEIKNGTKPIITVESMESKFNKNDLVEAFRMMEAKGLGVFILGRKGSKSRFEIGATKEQKVKTKSENNNEEYILPSPEEGPFSFSSSPTSEEEVVSQKGIRVNILENTCFVLANVSGGKDSVEEAVKDNEELMKLLDDNKFNNLCNGLQRFGIFPLNLLG